jgi:hypothetical protein
MLKMLENMKNPESLRLNCLNGDSDAFNTCGEKCDSLSLVKENQKMLELLLKEISHIMENPAAALPTLNDEQREVLINNYCGSVQVFLYVVGK